MKYALFEDVVRALLFANAHENAFFNHIDQVSAQSLRGDVGTQVLIIAIGDPPVVADMLQ